MALEIIFFIGACALLVALVYGTLSYRRRDRAAVRAAEEATRRRYREEENAAGVASLVDPPREPAAARRMREPNGVEPAFSEEDIQREKFGPRGVKGAPDPARMTPQRAKKTPSHIDQGHVS
jgi:hypothetical protein